MNKSYHLESIMALNNKGKCPKGYVMNQNGICSKSSGTRNIPIPDSTMDHPGGNTCVDQCYNFYLPNMEACVDASGTHTGSTSNCPGYCDGHQVCHDWHSFGGAEEICILATWYCYTASLTESLNNCIAGCAGHGGWIGERDAYAPGKVWRQGGRVRRPIKKRRRR